MALRERNKLLLAKTEVTLGTDPTPTASADAVRCENLQVDPQVNLIRTQEHTGSLDGDGPIAGGIKARVTFDVLLQGSGTPEVAPEWGPILQACGWAQTLSAATVPAGGAEACGAGGTTTTAELGATAAATAQLYTGMPITFSSEVSGQSFITDYTAAKIATLADLFAAIDADTSYLVNKNALWVPASNSLKSVTLYGYEDGYLYKVVGARGTFGFRMDAGGIGRFSFDMMGHLVSKTEATLPATPVFDTTRPPVWRGGRMLVERGQAQVGSFQLTNGMTVVMPGDPNKDEGFDYAIHTERNLTGNIDPLEVAALATRDILADLRAGTRRIIHARLGVTAGNRFAFTIPRSHYTGQAPLNREGLLAKNVPFDCVGKDSGAYICQY